MLEKFTAHMPVSLSERDYSFITALLRNLSNVIRHSEVVTNELPPRYLTALIDTLREEIDFLLQGKQPSVLFGGRNAPAYKQH